MTGLALVAVVGVIAWLGTLIVMLALCKAAGLATPAPESETDSPEDIDRLVRGA